MTTITQNTPTDIHIKNPKGETILKAPAIELFMLYSEPVPEGTSTLERYRNFAKLVSKEYDADISIEDAYQICTSVIQVVTDLKKNISKPGS